MVHDFFAYWINCERIVLEMNTDLDDFYNDFEPDDDFECEGCGRGEMDEGQCPMCCSMGGSYAPGCEECDWCPSSNECARSYFAKLRPRDAKGRFITCNH